MTSELRPAVEVWEDAYRAWDDAPIIPDRIGKVNGEGYSFVDEDRAAAAVIEADREAVRAEQAAEIERLTLTVRKLQGNQAALEAELAKFKALAETLAGALREIKDSWDWWQVDTYDRCSSVVEDAINEAIAAWNTRVGDSDV